MKIIDKTPLVDEKGELGFVQRVKGMFQFGFNWPNELQVQKAITTFFNRQFEKGYTLIRNITLGQSGITIPMVLLGPAGIFAIYVANLRGRYEARGDTWNVESGNQFKPAPINLIQQTSRMARALQVFIERQGVRLPVDIDPVLIAGDPGLHIESVRPAIRVMMIDGIKSFASGLAGAHPVLTAEAVHEFTERILNPRLPKKEPVAPPAPAPGAAWEPEQPEQPEVSRARAIFNAAEEAKPFDPADFDFAMDDDLPLPEAGPGILRETSPAIPLQQSETPSRRILGMTIGQLAVVAFLALCLIIVVVGGFIYIFYFAS